MTEQPYTHARFWKCALQVNPHGYSGSYRGQDHGLSAEAYIDKLREVCRQQDIKVVGLADHGSVQDVDRMRDALSPDGIVVFPGFEIASTEKVHMVCLFAEDTATERLERVLGRLGMDPEERVKPSNLGCLAIAKVVQEQDGFWYAAHMTGNSGLLRLHQDGGGLVHVWKNHELVQVGQIPGSIEDLDEKYGSIILNKNPDYRREKPITVINAKDVAKPEQLADPRSSTFIKMTSPCFASFLLAFKDPESRIRQASQMQERYYSRIDRVRIENGYLDGLTADLSGHLNAVIGGRGAGKSTLLECLRYALDVQHKAKDARKQGDQIVSENLGKAGGRVIVDLCSAANNMKRYKVIRRYGEPPRVIDESGNESTLHPGLDLLPGAEFYGQNEIYELVRSPGELTRVLDRFLPDSAEQQARLNSVYRKLRENGERLQKAQEKKEEIESRIAELPKLQERVRQYREQGLEEKLNLVPLLEKERQLEPRMRQEIERIRGARRYFEEELPDLTFLNDKALEGLPHADPFLEGRRILETLVETVHRKLAEIGTAADEAGRALVSQEEKLRQVMAESEMDIEKDFAALPAMAGRSGREVGVAYQGLLREIERIKPVRSELGTVNALVAHLEQERRNLLGDISNLRSARTAAKQNAVRRVNERLSGKLRIAVVPDGLRQPLRDFLQGLPQVGPERAKWVEDARELTIMGLVSTIRKGKDDLLNKGWGLTPGFAETLAGLDTARLHALEAIDMEDRIGIELNVSHSGGEHFKDLEHLSIGQQCTAILHLLLLNNPDPLIMDQPEDNLDNAFIAERIVKELRSEKTERQFLFATHNANIPVFGDAEWIGVCIPAGDRAEMPPDMQGSIDVPKIRDHGADILEGGREAFTQRRQKYGFDR